VPEVGCFVAGTQVATAGGSVRIDNIALGDRVLPDDATCHDGDQLLWMGGRPSSRNCESPTRWFHA